jgi:hypothetical protein
MLFLAALIAAEAPTASDVQAVEQMRVHESRADVARDGRHFVEFAPTVQTRNASCMAVTQGVYECVYDARLKEVFASEFGPWQARREQLERWNRRWRIARQP